jgi:hypothetical protein
MPLRMGIEGIEPYASHHQIIKAKRLQRLWWSNPHKAEGKGIEPS